MAGFTRKEGLPRTVIVISIAEVYSQCARALIRAKLWQVGDESAGLPSVGEMLKGVNAGFDGAGYDADWPGRSEQTKWADPQARTLGKAVSGRQSSSWIW